MYYESNSVDDILKCSFCRSKFTDVVKLIPECGNSICGECYKKILAEILKSNEYLCKECNEWHCMQSIGLGDNKAFMKMITLKPKEKALTNEGKILKTLIDDIQVRVNKLSNYDEGDEIISYCNQLVKDVMKTIDDAFKHLNSIGNELLDQINSYRSRAMDLQTVKCSAKRFKPSPSASVDSGISDEVKKDTDLDVLTKEMNDFCQEWREYFSTISKSATQEEIEKAQKRAHSFESKLEHHERLKRGSLFRGKLMHFKPNDLFCRSTKLLGELEYDFFPKDYLPRVDKDKVRAEAVRRMTEHTKTVRQALFLPGGRIASCSDDHTIKIWDEASGEMLYELQGHNNWVLCMALLPNDYLASGSSDYSIRIWDLKDKKLVRTIKEHTAPVFSLLALPDGNLASSSWDDTIKIWDPFLSHGNLLVSMSGHDSRYTVPMGLLANGNIVTCSTNKVTESESMIRIWNPRKGELIKTLGTNSKLAGALNVLRNGNLAVGFKDGTIKIFDLSDTASLVTLVHFESKVAHCFLELPNGYLLMGGSGKEPPIKVWNPLDGELIQVIETQHTHIISTLCLSSDGKRLISGSLDRNMVYWSLNY